MKRNSLEDRNCPISRGAAQLLDAWTFIVLREIFMSNRKYNGILAQTRMSPRSLAMRLAALVENGILVGVPYQDAPVREEYCLTEKGLELWPVLLTLRKWGLKWTGPWEDDIPLRLQHAGHDHDIDAGVICLECGETVGLLSSEVHLSPRFAKEREELASRSKT